MGLTTLAYVKQHLSVALTDTSLDTQLTQWLEAAVSLFRQETRRWLGGVISANTLANPTVCTSIGHQLETGDILWFNHSDSTPALTGPLTVTRLSDDTFSVPVNCTVAGTQGVYGRQDTEYYGGDGSQILILRNRPVQQLLSVYQDAQAFYGEASEAFAASTLLTAGTDYNLRRDTRTTSPEISRTGMVYRIASYWPPQRIRTYGNLALRQAEADGNIKATYVHGYCPMPADLQAGVAATVALMKLTAKFGRPINSESITYYSYSLGQLSDAKADITSAQKAIMRYRSTLI